jgi:hypothetical protein
MEINEINKALYEVAFIQNGEFGYHENNWHPSIDEREEEEMCEDENGNYIPATPLGYRDYKISRIQGIKNILDQHPCVNLTHDRHHQVKRNEGTIKMYDKIKIDSGDFVVIGDNEDKFFVVNEENEKFYIEYAKE